MSEHDPRLRVLASLLAQGRTVHLTTGVLTLGAWGFGGGAPVLSVAIAMVLGCETWLAARVGLDAALFEYLASGTDPVDLDRGLEGLGLVTKRSERALADRIRGALRLWRWQLILAAAQGTMMLLALIVRGFL